MYQSIFVGGILWCSSTFHISVLYKAFAYAYDHYALKELYQFSVNMATSFFLSFTQTNNENPIRRERERERKDGGFMTHSTIRWPINTLPAFQGINSGRPYHYDSINGEEGEL